MTALLEIELQPVWRSAREVRERIQQLLEDTDLPGDVGEMVSMVACELMENAVKYAALPTGESIHLSLVRRASHLELEVSSSLGPDATHHYNRLQETLQWLSGFEDPMDAYVDRMQAMAHGEETATMGSSGLGLARIACEGQAKLSCELDANQNLYVRARHHLE